MKLRLDNVTEKLKKNKYVLLLVAAGILLLLWPSGKREVSEHTGYGGGITNSEFSLADTELRLEKILESIDGAGDVSVLLSVGGSTGRVIAENAKLSEDTSGESAERTEERSAVLTGSGASENVVELGYIFPEYTGAVVVAEGASSPTVKLDILRAVSAVTGLGSDRITVIKMGKP